MKLLKDKYELTVREVSLLFEREDMHLLKRFRWVPGFVLRAHYARFMVEFSELFNSQELKGILNDDIYRLKIINKVNNILFPVYQGLALETLLNRELPEFRKIYEQTMGRKYNGTEDLKAIIREIERLRSKLDEMGTPEERVQSSGKVSFEQVVANTEMMLERNIPRDMTLFEFKKQYDLAILKAKEYEKIRNQNRLSR